MVSAENLWPISAYELVLARWRASQHLLISPAREGPELSTVPRPEQSQHRMDYGEASGEANESKQGGSMPAMIPIHSMSQPRPASLLPVTRATASSRTCMQTAARAAQPDPAKCAQAKGGKASCVCWTRFCSDEWPSHDMRLSLPPPRRLHQIERRDQRRPRLSYDFTSRAPEEAGSPPFREM